MESDGHIGDCVRCGEEKYYRSCEFCLNCCSIVQHRCGRLDEQTDGFEQVARVESETVDERGHRGIVKYGAGNQLGGLLDGTSLFTADQFIALMQEYPNLAVLQEKLEEYSNEGERGD